jgi:ATP-dependent RNA helicase RhlE
MSFTQFALHPSLLRAVGEAGYTQPTAIQQEAIPPALEGRDVLGCAMTGSGKTAAFVLPLLEHLFKRSRGTTRALILAPTRELAVQIDETIAELGKYCPVKSATVFGGVAMNAQVAAFQRGVDIIVATPGRLLDHMQHPYARLGSLEYLVFDEADRMLDMGFLPSIKKILAAIPKPKQTLFFSATMPAPIGKLAQQMLHQPISLNVERQAKPATGVVQSLYPVAQNLKAALLLELLASKPIERAIVFTRTKHRTNQVHKYLSEYGVKTERIHGNRSQAQRLDALKKFKAGQTRVLVATDIAARGIDVSELEYVINFDVPAIPEDYIHRVGRTARAERTGEAWTFFDRAEEPQIVQIERAIGQKLERVWVDGFNYKAVGEKLPNTREPRQPSGSRQTQRTPPRAGGQQASPRVSGQQASPRASGHTRPSTASQRGERAANQHGASQRGNAPQPNSGSRDGARPQQASDSRPQQTSGSRNSFRRRRGGKNA